MKSIVFGAFLAVVLAAAAGGATLFFGLFSFAADEPHAEAVTTVITFARERSITKASAQVLVPTDIDAPERRRRGAGNYDAMCVGCHLSPGARDSEIRKGLYPMPPDLSVNSKGAADGSLDARRFWIIKHGIKGSGMSAWAKGGMEDQAIWDMVAFLRALPGMSPEDYHKQVKASDGHVHAGHPHHDH